MSHLLRGGCRADLLPGHRAADPETIPPRQAAAVAERSCSVCSSQRKTDETAPLRGACADFKLKRRETKQTKKQHSAFCLMGFSSSANISQADVETSPRPNVSPARKSILFIIRSLLSRAFNVARLNTTFRTCSFLLFCYSEIKSVSS